MSETTSALDSWNLQSRPSIKTGLGAEVFDLLVIGGGITGASIFRDAALRGMRVVLVEARDFASGTSSRSSKLIHGGLRYLKRLGFRVARESCRERNLHMRLNKRLVRPMPFLIPFYKGSDDSRAKVRVGMILYEALSNFANHRFHRFLSREQTLLRAPGLPPDGLEGSCLYYDAVVSDSRWTIEILKDGVRHGGMALNYARVVRLLWQDDQPGGAEIVDGIAGGTEQIRARCVVNATGAFADGVRKLARRPTPDGQGASLEPSSTGSGDRLVRLSRGTHLVFAEEDVPLTMTTVFRSPLDGRPLFLAKHDGCFLYGTSDEWHDGAPDDPAPTRTDVDYLLESLRLFMPEAALGRGKVRFAYAGFRPLINPGPGGSGDAAISSDAPREDLIEEEARGLITVVGGKLTTARLTAIRVLERVSARIGPSAAWSRCRTDRLSIGGTNELVAEAFARRARSCPRLTATFRILFRRYGLDADGIAAEAIRIHRGERGEPVAEPAVAELEYVCRHEMVCTIEDLIDRRAGFLSWTIERRLEEARRGRARITALLGLTPEAFDAQYAAYETHLRRLHSVA
jgi:glycerol-3-phosphate dehydrogenase